MPLYEYQCGECDQEFELLVKADEKPDCPKCEKDSLQKLLSLTASPSTGSGKKELPIAAENCQVPRCCGGGCQM